MNLVSPKTGKCPTGFQYFQLFVGSCFYTVETIQNILFEM